MMNEERWFSLSLAEKMGNIGSEISRARRWEEKNNMATRNSCLERALELIDLTKNNKELHGRYKEICLLHELVACKYIDSNEYDVSLADLDKYCFEFALVARKDY